MPSSGLSKLLCASKCQIVCNLQVQDSAQYPTEPSCVLIIHVGLEVLLGCNENWLASTYIWFIECRSYIRPSAVFTYFVEICLTNCKIIRFQLVSGFINFYIQITISSFDSWWDTYQEMRLLGNLSSTWLNPLSNWAHLLRVFYGP